MAEKTLPWWRKALNFALGTIRTGFGLFPRPAKPFVIEEDELLVIPQETQAETASQEVPSKPIDPIPVTATAPEPATSPVTTVVVDEVPAETPLQEAPLPQAVPETVSELPQPAAEAVEQPAEASRHESGRHWQIKVFTPAAETPSEQASDLAPEASSPQIEPEISPEPATPEIREATSPHIEPSEIEAEVQVQAEPEAEPISHSEPVALQPAEEPSPDDALKGHDFSRAEEANTIDMALEPVAEEAAEKLSLDEAVSGHDFSRAEEANTIDMALGPVALQPAEEPSPDDALKGHDFSRAEEANRIDMALATAVSSSPDSPSIQPSSESSESPSESDEPEISLSQPEQPETIELIPEAQSSPESASEPEPEPTVPESTVLAPVEPDPAPQLAPELLTPADPAPETPETPPIPAPLPVTEPAPLAEASSDPPPATSPAQMELIPKPLIDEKTAARLAAKEKRRLEEDAESPFSVIVDQVYDGPLDLLLDLIRKQDIDIYDIPIAKITAQFLAYVNQLKASDVDVAGEFIYTASLLIHIKSKMLLPRTAEAPGEADEDPRRELVERLLEHERFKNAAQMLQQKQMLEAATWSNPGYREFQNDEGAEPEIAADTVDLVRIFREILERARNRPVIDVEEDSVTVGQMIKFLGRRLTMEDKPIALRRLLSHTRSERALIAMFLALLELVRLQAILLRQDQAFSDILIKKHADFDVIMNEGLANATDDWR